MIQMIISLFWILFFIWYNNVKETLYYVAYYRSHIKMKLQLTSHFKREGTLGLWSYWVLKRQLFSYKLSICLLPWILFIPGEIIVHDRTPSSICLLAIPLRIQSLSGSLSLSCNSSRLQKPFVRSTFISSHIGSNCNRSITLWLKGQASGQLFIEVEPWQHLFHWRYSIQ